MASSHAQNGTPTVSRVLSDGRLVELLYDAPKSTTSLAVGQPGEEPEIVSSIGAPGGECLVPYAAANNLIRSGCVLLPSVVGAFDGKAALLEEVREYLHRYVDLSPAFEEIAAYYILLSWVFDAFNELPYLRLRGDYGTGKTRALLAIGSICYRPFFASGASTVSPIFHVLDRFGGTLVLDEADLRFSDATADLTKILNNGTVRGMPVLRTITNRHREFNPTAFSVYGPKLIAMRESFSDRALESRFLTEETGGRPLRSDIPISLPSTLAEEALGLRNKLLAWRFAAMGTVGPDPSRLIEGIEPRFNQTALALLSIMDDEATRNRLRRELVGYEARALSERASSLEATMLAALIEAREISDRSVIRISSVADVFSRKNSSGFEPGLTNKRIGWVIRTKLRITTTKSNGVYVIPQSEYPRIDALAVRYGLRPARGEHVPQAA